MCFATMDSVLSHACMLAVPADLPPVVLLLLAVPPCSEAGITFAGVHDSFWTHAGHVPAMNKLLRDKFVELHTRQV